MIRPLIPFASVEDDGFKAFGIGRRAKVYRPYGFAFCPYDCGTTLRANWVQGYARAFNSATRAL